MILMWFDLLCNSIGSNSWRGCIKAQQFKWCKWGYNKWTCYWSTYTWPRSSNPQTCEWSFCKLWWDATSTWKTSLTWGSKFRGSQNWHYYSRKPKTFWCINGRVYFKGFNTIISRIFHIYVVSHIIILEYKNCAFSL